MFPSLSGRGATGINYEEPSGWGGEAWTHPFDRRDGRWRSYPIAPLVTYWTSQEDNDGNVTEVGAVAGMVSSAVKAIRCDTSRDNFAYDVDSPVATFVIVMEHADNVELTAIDAVGNEFGVPVDLGRHSEVPILSGAIRGRKAGRRARDHPFALAEVGSTTGNECGRARRDSS